MGRLFIVDCEARGPCPSKGKLTQFGVVDFNAFVKGTRQVFHGEIYKSKPDPVKPVQSVIIDEDGNDSREIFVFTEFDKWIKERCQSEQHTEPAIFVSDNPAFDWQWINDGFWRILGRNPFGHSARRIGDFYAGLVNDFRKASAWKKLRVTKHDHNPVHDAIGNAEALKTMMDKYLP